jgi:phosphoserine phosphatase
MVSPTIEDPKAAAAPFEFSPGLTVRGIAPPLSLGDYRLVAFDMDSTLITIECVDEIADVVGRKAEVAALTEAAMRGQITDYKESLRRRVALLAGVTEQQIDRVYRERLHLSPGVMELLLACKVAGLKVLLVSGGFTHFAERLRERLSLDFVRSNQLEVVDGRLTGRIVPQCWGDICDGAMKRETLLSTCSLIGCTPQQAIAIGDGANDLAMMAVAGLSVAYHAKPKTREQAQVAIDTGGLDRLLELFQP